MQDTKRALIEEEAAFLFQKHEIKELLDVDKIAVYGPHRSVGMLKFSARQGENFSDTKDRMWKVIKSVATLKHVLPSTRLTGEGKTLWMSFVKTKDARARSTHVSMIRRVVIDPSEENAAHPGGLGAPSICTEVTACDCDWSLGTIWCGQEKLGFATHRQPKEGEVIAVHGFVVGFLRGFRCEFE